MGKIVKIVLAVTNDLETDQRMHRICNSLYSMGYDVTLVGRKRSFSSKMVQENYNKERLSLFFTKGMLFYLEYNLRLLLYLYKHKPSVVVSNDLDTLLASFILTKLVKTKLVYDSHELFTEVPELIGRKFKKKLWEKLESYILPKLSNSYTVCNSIAQIYNNKYGISMNSIRNLPLKKEYLPANDLHKEKHIIIYQGALNLGRGIELMITAMQFLDNCKLMIIGDGDVTEQLKELSKSLNLQFKIEFIGKIPLSQLHQYTSRASLGLSLEEDLGLSYHYALPNKLFDYIQAQIPVIVSDLPEMKAIVEKYNVGLVLKTREARTLAKEIKRVFSLRESTNLKNNLKIAASELCWENEEQKLKHIFKNLV